MLLIASKITHPYALLVITSPAHFRAICALALETVNYFCASEYLTRSFAHLDFATFRSPHVSRSTSLATALVLHQRGGNHRPTCSPTHRLAPTSLRTPTNTLDTYRCVVLIYNLPILFPSAELDRARVTE